MEQVLPVSFFAQQFLDASREGVIFLDASPPFMITHVNQIFEQVTSYQKQRVIGHPLSVICDFQPIDVIELCDHASETQSVVVRIDHQHADVTGLYSDWKVTSIQDVSGRVSHLMCVHVQTHKSQVDHLYAEQELRQSEERYRMLTENALDIVYRISFLPSMHFEYVSPAVTDITGYTPEDHYDDPMLGYKLIHSDDVHILDDAVRTPNEPLILRWVCKDGRVIWTEQLNRHIFDDNGNLVAIEGIARDITERVLSQQKIFELKLEVERRKLLTDFIQNVTHEFRTPLTIIATSTYLLCRLDDLQKRQHKIEMIDSQINNITTLIDMLSIMVELENYDFDGVSTLKIDDLLETSWRQILKKSNKSHRVVCKLQPDLPLMVGNEQYLQVAFSHLLNNAYNFTPPDGTICINAHVSDGSIVVEIKDTGVGISEEAKQHIFKTFWRLDTARSTPGFGLGLPIAKKIIELHQGTIEVESQLNKGSCFRIMLPV